MTSFKDITSAEIESLLARMEAAEAGGPPLPPEDLALLREIIRSFAHLQERLQNNDLTMRRLRKLLGIEPKSEKSPEPAAKPEGKGGVPKPAGRGRPHGKSHQDEYPEATVIHHRHEALKSGDTCPDCREGKLYKFEPSTFVRIVGQAPLAAQLHVVEQLRCNNCNKVFKASIPDEVSRDGPIEQRFGYSARALIAMMKYCAATPFYRQHVLQRLMRTPIAASTMWDQCELLAAALLPIFRRLKALAAGGALIFSDDTGNRILRVDKVIKKQRGSDRERERTGVHTSGLLSVLPDGKEIVLYKTGINHAGEFIDSILEHRPKNLPSPLHMSDALSGNRATVCVTMRCLCNAHARRQFTDIESRFPDEAQFVVDTYKVIYQNESETKDMDPGTRLAFHEEKSLPLMQAMFSWAQNKLDAREAEPNSALGGALKYLIKHQEALLGFCRYEGAPVDNNAEENKLRLVVLHRKNALFFKEQAGADVADVIMSVCSTASAAGVNVMNYLVEVQRHAADARNDPDTFLPWAIKLAAAEGS